MTGVQTCALPILEAIKQATTGKLKEVKEAVPENISYTEIRAVYAKHFG